MCALEWRSPTCQPFLMTYHKIWQKPHKNANHPLYTISISISTVLVLHYYNNTRNDTQNG